MFAPELSLILAALLPAQAAGADVDTNHVAVGQAPVVIALVESDASLAQELARGAEVATRAWNHEHPETQLLLRPLEPEGPWLCEGHALAYLIQREDVAAVIGPVGDAQAHLVAQLSTRLRVPVPSPFAAAARVAAGAAWAFTCV